MGNGKYGRKWVEVFTENGNIPGSVSRGLAE